MIHTISFTTRDSSGRAALLFAELNDYTATEDRRRAACLSRLCSTSSNTDTPRSGQQLGGATLPASKKGGILRHAHKVCGRRVYLEAQDWVMPATRIETVPRSNAPNAHPRRPMQVSSTNWQAGSAFCPWARRAVSAQDSSTRALPHHFTIPVRAAGPSHFAFARLFPVWLGWHWEGGGNGLANKVRKVPATCSGYTEPGNYAGLVAFALLILCCTWWCPGKIWPSLTEDSPTFSLNHSLPHTTHTPSQAKHSCCSRLL